MDVSRDTSMVRSRLPFNTVTKVGFEIDSSAAAH
jgi:hypothetical protein